MSRKNAIKERFEALDKSSTAPELAVEKWAETLQLAFLLEYDEARFFAREVSGKTARGEIADYQELCLRLKNQILALSKTSFDALNSAKKRPSGPLDLYWILRDHVEMSVPAHDSIDPEQKGKVGAPRLHYAPHVAGVLARAYWEITGKRPTVPVNYQTSKAYGPFLDLVTDIFKLLNIDASPESQARAAIKEITTP